MQQVMVCTAAAVWQVHGGALRAHVQGLHGVQTSTVLHSNI